MGSKTKETIELIDERGTSLNKSALCLSLSLSLLKLSLNSVLLTQPPKGWDYRNALPYHIHSSQCLLRCDINIVSDRRKPT